MNQTVSVTIERGLYKVSGIHGCGVKWVQPTKGRCTKSGALAAARWAVKNARKGNPLTRSEVAREAAEAPPHFYPGVKRDAWGRTSNPGRALPKAVAEAWRDLIYASQNGEGDDDLAQREYELGLSLEATRTPLRLAFGGPRSGKGNYARYRLVPTRTPGRANNPRSRNSGEIRPSWAAPWLAVGVPDPDYGLGAATKNFVYHGETREAATRAAWDRTSVPDDYWGKVNGAYYWFLYRMLPDGSYEDAIPGQRARFKSNPRPSTTRSKSDRDVIEAFLRRQPAHGRKLTSTGARLDGNWMGGRGIAEWQGEAVVFNDLGSRAAQSVQRAVKKLRYQDPRFKNPRVKKFGLVTLLSHPYSTVESWHRQGIVSDDDWESYVQVWRKSAPKYSGLASQVDSVAPTARQAAHIYRGRAKFEDRLKKLQGDMYIPPTDWSPRSRNPGRVTGSYKGVSYSIGPRTPFPGIGWVIPKWIDGRKTESGGAFYDDVPEHPEGAYAWAERAVKKFIDQGGRRANPLDLMTGVVGMGVGYALGAGMVPGIPRLPGQRRRNSGISAGDKVVLMGRGSTGTALTHPFKDKDLNMAGPWHEVFPKTLRDAVAIRFARDFEEKARAGEFTYPEQAKASAALKGGRKGNPGLVDAGHGICAACKKPRYRTKSPSGPICATCRDRAIRAGGMSRTNPRRAVKHITGDFAGSAFCGERMIATGEPSWWKLTAAQRKKVWARTTCDNCKRAWWRVDGNEGRDDRQDNPRLENPNAFLKGPPTVDRMLHALSHELTEYDRRENVKYPNIYRLGHLLGASNKVSDDVRGLGSRSDREALNKLRVSLAHHFTLPFPPVNKVLRYMDKMDPMEPRQANPNVCAHGKKDDCSACGYDPRRQFACKLCRKIFVRTGTSASRWTKKDGLCHNCEMRSVVAKSLGKTQPGVRGGEDIGDVWTSGPGPYDPRLANPSGCRRCNGAGQVKLGPRMVRCPTCCRKKNPLTRTEALRELGQARGMERTARGQSSAGNHGFAILSYGEAMGRAGVVAQRAETERLRDLGENTHDRAHFAGRAEIGKVRKCNPLTAATALAVVGAGAVGAVGGYVVGHDAGVEEEGSRRSALARKKNPLLSHNAATCRCFYHKKLRGGV